MLLYMDVNSIEVVLCICSVHFRKGVAVKDFTDIVNMLLLVRNILNAKSILINK